MRKLAVAALAVGLAFAGNALAQGAAALSGVWVGYYGYDGGVPEEVEFQMKLTPIGQNFNATTVEINTFGDRNTWFLTANVVGSVGPAGGIRFTKTYDGTGGQTHSVQYEGVLRDRCITGRWAIAAAGGPFKMCSDAQLIS